MFPLRPMEPIVRNTPFQDTNFLYQVKWDGVRMLADKQRQIIRLWNRKGHERTLHYPEIVAPLSSIATRDVLLDGEVISLSAEGKPDFHRILQRDLAKKPRFDVEPIYVVFDCLRVNEQWLINEPIEVRLAKMRQIVKADRALFVAEDFDDGLALFSRMEELKMEGMVAKRRESIYRPGEKSDDWQKVKCWQFGHFDVLGLKMVDGQPRSLVIGDRATKQRYGTVASGLTASHWRNLRQYMHGVGIFNNSELMLPAGVTADIRFLEWTPTLHLRSPSLLQLHI